MGCLERAAPDCGETAAGSANVTQRKVWIPPGMWEDVWTGTIVQGPRIIQTAARFDRLPMWHKRANSFLIICDKPALRINKQDWSTITVDAFLGDGAASTQRSLYDQLTGHQTSLTLSYKGGVVVFDDSPDENVGVRAWVIRLHLLVGETVVKASMSHN